MKSRIVQVLIALFVFVAIPFNVDAAGSVSVSVSCNNVILDKTTKCAITGRATGTVVSGFQASYSLSSNVSYVDFDAASGWQGDGDSGKIELYTDTNKSGTFAIGTITLKGTKIGKASIVISGIGASDADFNEIGGISNAASSFYVNKATTTTTTKKTTKKTTTTTRKNNKTTVTTLHISTTTTTTTTTTLIPLRLSSVVVDGFDVSYEDGKYYVTVDPETEEVTVNATAASGIQIIGTGKRSLVEGKNVVDLILRDATNRTETVQVVITRPEGSGVYDTKLTSLKVVDYELEFDPSKYEYTVTVPFNTKEVYVIAKAINDDVIITGDGLKTISKDNNNKVYVKVSYGNLASTEYTITIKKSYTMLIMWIAIGGLSIGFIGFALYAQSSKKKAVAAVVAEKNKVLATNNRAESVSASAGIEVNGEKVAGIARRTVVPTPVAAISETPSSVEEVKPITIETQAPKVVVKKAPVQMVSTAPQAQVKVIKTTEPEVQTDNTNPMGYKEDDIVIKEL